MISEMNLKIEHGFSKCPNCGKTTLFSDATCTTIDCNYSPIYGQLSSNGEILNPAFRPTENSYPTNYMVKLTDVISANDYLNKCRSSLIKNEWLHCSKCGGYRIPSEREKCQGWAEISDAPLKCFSSYINCSRTKNGKCTMEEHDTVQKLYINASKNPSLRDRTRTSEISDKIWLLLSDYPK